MGDFDQILDDVLGTNKEDEKATASMPFSKEPQVPQRAHEIFKPKQEQSLLEGTKSLLDDVLGEVIGLDTNFVGSAGAPPKPGAPTMMCRKCDFDVMSFDDSFWLGTCDYLFFRNHFPQVPKLREGLGKKPGKRALACQCRWAVIDKSQHAWEAGVSCWIIKRGT
ncbi:unnamed protein product [Amoebophrya sp. A25]|nr:unnamed protein product [Amoebophrya sp. A25]|eukprot:GSA25T00005146001.1